MPSEQGAHTLRERAVLRATIDAQAARILELEAHRTSPRFDALRALCAALEDNPLATVEILATDLRELLGPI